MPLVSKFERLEHDAMHRWTGTSHGMGSCESADSMTWWEWFSGSCVQPPRYGDMPEDVLRDPPLPQVPQTVPAAPPIGAGMTLEQAIQLSKSWTPSWMMEQTRRDVTGQREAYMEGMTRGGQPAPSGQGAQNLMILGVVGIAALIVVTRKR